MEARTRELRDVIDGLESFNRQISHDLRGPLGGIGGLAQLASEALQRGDLAAAQRLLPPIAQQAEVTARLVDALLMLARSGEVALNKVPLELARLAQEVTHSLAAAGAAGAAGAHGGDRRAAGGRGRRDAAARRDDQSDRQCHQVQRRPADGKVRISADSTPGMVTVAVADNGVGFDSSAARRCSSRSRACTVHASPAPASGLTIVRRIVERHGGKVWAVGQPGAGAIFTFHAAGLRR